MPTTVLFAIGNISTSTNAPSISLALGTGANRVLVGFAGCANTTGPTLTSLTLAGATNITFGAQILFNGRPAYPFTALLTDSGTQTLAAAWSVPANMFFVCVVLQGDGAMSFGAPVASSSTWTTQPSIDITDSATGDVIVSLFQENSGVALTAGSGESFIAPFTGATSSFRHAMQTAGGAGTVNVSGTFAGTPNVMGMAVAVKSAAPAAPTITGPSGAAGAGSSTANLAENATTGPTFSTDIGLGSGYPTLTGTDASLFTLNALSSTSWRVDPVAPFNFDSGLGSNPKNVAFNASATVSQACAITVTNVNEAPAFTGANVPNQVLTVGVAMTPVAIASRFTDPEGLAVTASIVETLPAGLSIVSGSLQGTPTAAQAAATYTPRGTDPGGNGANGPTFTITVNAPVTYSLTTEEMWNNTLAQLRASEACTASVWWGGAQPGAFAGKPLQELTGLTSNAQGRLVLAGLTQAGACRVQVRFADGGEYWQNATAA
jgi:hypothetical protein